jgi:hypothetical protein
LAQHYSEEFKKSGDEEMSEKHELRFKSGVFTEEILN